MAKNALVRLRLAHPAYSNCSHALHSATAMRDNDNTVVSGWMIGEECIASASVRREVARIVTCCIGTDE
jgi:hypothetical protein